MNVVELEHKHVWAIPILFMGWTGGLGEWSHSGISLSANEYKKNIFSWYRFQILIILESKVQFHDTIFYVKISRI